MPGLEQAGVEAETMMTVSSWPGSATNWMTLGEDLHAGSGLSRVTAATKPSSTGCLCQEAVRWQAVHP